MTSSAGSSLWTASPVSRRILTVSSMASWLPPLIPGNRAGAYAGRALLNTVTMIGYQHPRRSLVRRVDEPGAVRGEWVSGPARPGQRVLYYLHGSGYIGCSPATHRGLVAQLTSRTGRPAFVLRYRRGPEHRFPAAHQDAVAGFLWLLDQGFDPSDIVVAGDSAGGHLAVALCGELRRRGIGQPAGLVLMSPLIDPTYDVAAEYESVSRDPFIRVGIARRLTGLYTVGADTTDPRLDVRRDVGADLPPMLIQAGGREILRADAEQYAAALRIAGGTCDLQIWRGQMHVFQLCYRILPEAREALDRIQQFITDLDASASRPKRASTG